MRIFYLTAFVFFLGLSPRLTAQDSTALTWVDISKITLAQTLEKNIDYGYIDADASLPNQYHSILFKRGGNIHRRFVEDKNVTRKIILRFKARNTSDSAVSVWFYPGYYYWDIHLYRETGNNLQAIRSVTPDYKNEISYRYMTLPAEDSAVFVAELIPVRTYLNTIRPKLINPRKAA